LKGGHHSDAAFLLFRGCDRASHRSGSWKNGLSNAFSTSNGETFPAVTTYPPRQVPLTELRAVSLPFYASLNTTGTREIFA